MACGNSVEMNISSNVTMFAGQQQIELVSAIIKSTTSSNNSSSATNTTDVSVAPMATIPYQATISGNKVTVFVLSSSRETHQLLSPSVKTSFSKLYPLLRLCIDHPLITMTTNNDNVKYNISCYDAHIDLSIGGKNSSSKCVCVCVTHIHTV